MSWIIPKEIVIKTKDDEMKIVRVIRDISDSSSENSYPTQSGLYITHDYGDGRVDIEFYVGGKDEWIAKIEECEFLGEIEAKSEDGRALFLEKVK